MLTADEIKPYLLHEDRPVREAASAYFADSFAQDETLVPTILRACDLYGEMENIHSLSLCRRFAPTEEAFEDILARLERATHPDVELALNRIVANAPTTFLIKYENAIEANANLFDNIRRHVQCRREHAGLSGLRLWAELREFARGSADQKYVGDIDHSLAEAIIAALAAHDVPDAETICNLLRSPGEAGDWLDIFLIQLAGERAIDDAIPLLVGKFRIHTDYMLEQCSKALAKMGHPEAIRLIREAFPDESWHFKNYTSALLGRIKAEESEEAIIDLLESERDRSIRTSLCYGLCQLLSPRGVEVVRREIQVGFDADLVDLRFRLLPVLQMLGMELPEAEEWRKKREERERFQAERRRELNELGRRYAALKEKGADPLAGAGASRQTEPKKPAPLRQARKKIRGNSPCPCGSGKKYKKCCGWG